MPRLAPRWHAPLVVVVVAALGLLGVATATAFGQAGGADTATGQTMAQTTLPDGHHAERSLLAGRAPAIVVSPADHLRSPARHGVPFVAVVGAAVACLVLAPAGAVPIAASMRPSALPRHARERGPPSLNML